jgi:hypothetical protein
MGPSHKGSSPLSHRLRTGCLPQRRRGYREGALQVARDSHTTGATRILRLSLCDGLILGEMQQPVAGRANERITVGAVLAVQCEQDPAVVSVVLLPPSMIGDGLVSVLVGEVVQFVIRDLDCESILCWAYR